MSNIAIRRLNRVYTVLKSSENSALNFCGPEKILKLFVVFEKLPKIEL